MQKKPQASTLTKEDLWQALLAEAELEVSRANFLTWFKKTTLRSIEGGVAYIAVPNNFAKEWLEAKYRKFILRALRSYDQEIRDVSFSLRAPASTSLHEAQQPALIPQAVVASAPLPLKTSAQHESGLSPRYTFSSFVVGSSNELAHAAALAVTKQLGRLYNPLFIYGGVGLGKTHLLQAVGNRLLHENPGLRIRYISSERFVRDLIAAIKTRATEQFKEVYRAVDLLIIDDIQFIGGKESTQEELFHTFNEVSGREAQIIFSSDRPPHAIPGLEDRLRSRFEGGMIADIQPPDFETRVAIIHMKGKERGVEVPDEAAQTIAQLVERNIRELEGALIRILSQEARESSRMWAPARIQEILRSSLPPPQRLTFKDIIRAIARYYDLREEELFEKSRRQEIVRPRQIAMYFSRELLQMSYPAIGKRFHGLDHTTVMHAYDRVQRGIRASHPLADEIAGIQTILKTVGR